MLIQIRIIEALHDRNT